MPTLDLHTQLRWLDHLIDGAEPPPEHEAGPVPVQALISQLALISALPEDEGIELDAFVPAPPEALPPLPPELEAQLLSIATGGDGHVGVRGALGSVWRWLTAPWLAGALAVAAALLFALPRSDTGVIKGPAVDLTSVTEDVVAVHLVRHGAQGRVQRLELEPLELGGVGVVVKGDEALLPVLQAPERDLSEAEWVYYTMATDGDQAWTVGEPVGPAPLKALPGTAHLYTADSPLRLAARGESPVQLRVFALLVPAPLTEEQVDTALAASTSRPLRDGRARALVSGASVQGSLLVELR